MEKYFTWITKAGSGTWVVNMNTDPARGPRDSANWQSMDIFVFANGQQYSPPRKYHLLAEELERWEQTLCDLAVVHYGPRYTTIELYTTDGRKIDGPLELSNCGTYVAVIPPDDFIDTGYERYLLKASRSWERRQQLKSGTMAKTKPDAVIVIETIPEEECKIIEEVSEEDKVITKLKATTKCQGARPIKLNSSKPLEAKAGSNTYVKSNIPKKNLPTSTMRKSSIRSKNALTKRTSKFSGVKIKYSEIEHTKEFNKHIITVTDQIIPSNYTEDVHELVNKDSNRTILLDGPSVAMTSPIKSTPSLNISDLYMNSEKDKTVTSIPLISNEPVIKQDDYSDKEEINAIIKQLIDHVLDPKFSVKDTIPPPDVLSGKCIDKYVTLINKGDTVNVKLHIEVKNPQGVTILHEKKEEIINIPKENHSSSSQTNLNIKISRISLQHQQVNESQKSSLEDILNDIYFRNRYERPKVVVVNCPCCWHQYFVNETPPDPSNTKRFGKKNIVVMPVNTYDGAGPAKNVKDNNNSEKNKIKLNTDAEEKENKPSTTSSVSTVLQVEEPYSDNVKLLDYDKYELGTIDLHKIYSHKHLEGSLSRSVQFEETKHVIPNLTNKNMVDASVLTDWCNIILEAKIDDDGRYAFYLPTLEVLREYNF